MVPLLHVDPEEFLLDSVRLGKKIYASGFRPKHAISIWRGGTPVGLGVDAFFRSRGLRLNHTTIATDSYRGIAQQAEVIVKNLEHLVRVVCPEDGLLIIDDVYESGNTIKRVVELLQQMARANTPERIVVGVVHHKPERQQYRDLPVVAVREIAADVWIDYPHELADLVEPDDADDRRIREKDETLWKILRGGPTAPTEVAVPGDYLYLSARELLYDCARLGVNIALDHSFRPDFLVALWPGGVVSGLPVHEVSKYFHTKQPNRPKPPDHISVNTFPTHLSYRDGIIGIEYLADRINRDDNVLVLDTTFRAGRQVNELLGSLKEVLRRNLTDSRVRVASVYYNPEDRSTWTVRPYVRKPDYYLKLVRKEVVYPTSVHKLRDPRQELRTANPRLWNVLYGDED